MRTLVLLILGPRRGGCASRLVNLPLAQADRKTGYRYETRHSASRTATRSSSSPFPAAARAAAFSFGVLEELRRTELAKGRKERLLDEVDVITGVSGGSFTALAYGLYGERLFDDYPNALPQAQRAGRTAHAIPVAGQLGRRCVVGGLGALGNGGTSSTTRSCSRTRHSATWRRRRPADHGDRDRHLHRVEARFVQTEWGPDLLWTCRSVPLSRAGGAVVGGAACACRR